MVDHVNKRTRPRGREGTSYASRKPGLREAMPDSLRKAGSTKATFDHARDPWLSKQLKAEQQSEARRRETGDGSKMVKLHKPFPELRPKRERSPIRQSFNRAWLREDREAQMRQLEAQAEHMRNEVRQEKTHEHSTPTRSRTR